MNDHSRLAESVNQRPMRPFLGRFFYRDNDEITARRPRNHVRRREMALLPTVRLFGQFSFGVINVNRNFRALDLGSHPKPVFVALEQLLPDGLFLARSEIATPIIFANLETLFDVLLSRLKRERLRIVHCAAGAPRQNHTHGNEKTDSQTGFYKSVHERSVQSFVTMPLSSLFVISLIFRTESAEICAALTSIRGLTCPRPFWISRMIGAFSTNSGIP